FRTAIKVVSSVSWMWFGPGPVGEPLTVIVKEPSGLRTRSRPERTDAVVPDKPVSTLNEVSAGSSPVKRPVITYVDVLFAPLDPEDGVGVSYRVRAAPS